jgi:hypothetical protein
MLLIVLGGLLAGEEACGQMGWVVNHRAVTSVPHHGCSCAKQALLELDDVLSPTSVLHHWPVQ